MLNYTQEGGKIWCKYQQPEAKLCFLQCCLKVRITRYVCAHIPFSASSLEVTLGCSVLPQPYVVNNPCPLVSTGRKPALLAGSSDIQSRGLGLQGVPSNISTQNLDVAHSFQSNPPSSSLFPFFPSSTVQKKHRWNTVWASFAWDNRGISFSFSPSFCTQCSPMFICSSDATFRSKFACFNTGNLCTT